MKQKFSYSFREMNARLLAIGRPIRKYLVVSTLASVVGSLSHMGLMGFGALWLLSAAGLTGSGGLYAALTALSAALIALCRYLEGVYSHMGAYGILAKVRVHLFDAIDRISPAFLIGRETGDLLNIAVSDIETLEFFFAHTIGPMFTVVLLPVTTIALAFSVHPLYGWLLIPVYLMISVVLPLLALKAGRGIGMRYRQRLGTLKSKILESVYGIRDIQIFGAADRKTAEVLHANEEVNRASLGLTLHRQTVASLPTFFVYLARILILVCAGVLSARGIDHPVGTIALSFAATASLSSTFNLTFVVTSLLETYAAAERLFLIEDAVPETVEPDDPVACGAIETIEFRDVSFAYPHTDRLILNHLTLTIHRGDQVGISGESGAGKSTILRLLLRFYAPTAGQILINGIPIERISLAELHRRIAFLEQDTYLFDTTIAENIRIAKPDATMEEVRRAAEGAGIAPFIDTLPDGYDTDMGQMNARLSGGERQRIGIARILLRAPDVCLMDEPSSALDALHERELLHTLKTAYAGRTLVLISHRQSTLAGCTRLVTLRGRRLEE